MIDLHSHILPGIDDGARSIDISVEMARLAVADGVVVQACTPHIMPGVYSNEGPQIRAAVTALQQRLNEEGLPLHLTTGADNHIVFDFVAGLTSGRLLTLGDTRYVLVEPSHYVAPPRMADFFFNLMVAGYFPILTHPERLTWIEQHYDTIRQLAHGGVLMQITAGSLTGAFGRRPLYWAERMLGEGRAHLLASDAHDVNRRCPNMGAGREAAAKLVGEEEAHRMVAKRPYNILQNLDLNTLDIEHRAIGLSAGEGTYAKDFKNFKNYPAEGNRHRRAGREGGRGGGAGNLLDRLRSILRL